MNRETTAMAASGVASSAGIGNSIWLWMISDPAAHGLTVLTGLLVLSQLFWGWRKFLREEGAR